MQDEVAAAVPASRADDVVGHAVARPRRRRARPARGRRAWPCVDVAPLHPRVRRPLLLPSRRRARRSARRAGPAAAHDMTGRDELAAGLARVRGADRRGLRRRRARPGRGPAGRGHQDLPGRRRPAARRARGHRRRARTSTRRLEAKARRVRRPRPALALHRRTCRATRPARWPTYADVVESVDRGKLVGAPMGAHERADPSTCCSRSASTRPGATHRSGADPERPGRPGRRGRRRGAPRAARPDGRRAARRGPARRRSRGWPRSAPEFLASPPRGDLALRRDERRPRARDPGRRDTRACRLRGPRFEALGPVAFKHGRSHVADPEGRQS